MVKLSSFRTLKQKQIIILKNDLSICEGCYAEKNIYMKNKFIFYLKSFSKHRELNILVE